MLNISKVFLKLKDFYRIFVIVFFNALVFILILNFLSYYVLLNKSKKDYSADILKFIMADGYSTNLYNLNLPDNYIEANINDMLNFNHRANNEFNYYPILENVHSEFSSQNINIVKLQQDLPKRISYNLNCEVEKSVYCFGGSTTFGYLVADMHTWPSFLSKELNKDNNTCYSISNYGTNGYTPNQETLQFIELIKLGHRPSVAVFLDGLNVGGEYSGGEFSKPFSERFDNPTKNNLQYLVSNLPVINLIKNNEIEDVFSDSNSAATILAFSQDKNQLVSNGLIFNAELRKTIGEKYNIQVINILQPNAFYKNKFSNISHIIEQPLLSEIEKNYETIYTNLINSKPSLFNDFSNLSIEYNAPAYIDLVHYSPEFNYFLANQISKTLKNLSMGKHEIIIESASTTSF